MNIVLVTDAWTPQVNGVVTTLTMVVGELRAMDHEVTVIAPDNSFKTIPCPTYPEIRLAIWPLHQVGAMIEAAQPDAVHISTEGPLGLAARRHCLRTGRLFTTAYHTKFPEYIHARCRLPLTLGYAAMRQFHGRAAGVMVATQRVRSELESNGFKNIRDWSRGVDTEIFRPDYVPVLDLPRPINMYVGRVAVEKNLPAFLQLDLPGSKVVVGDGPQLAELRRRFPEVHYTGAKFGAELAAHFATADVFVFPSRTDTFGLVTIESLACGTPVAAYPVPGPLDVIGDAPVGGLNEDLAAAVDTALTRSRATCRAFALRFSWRSTAKLFLQNLAQSQLQSAK